MTKYTCKTKKRRTGGRKYDNANQFPHIVQYQDITDNAKYLTEIGPHDIHNYAVDNVYYMQVVNDDMDYIKLRVKNINVIQNTITVIPALAKGQKYASINPSTININRIKYAYLVDVAKEDIKNVRNLGMEAILKGSEAQKRSLGIPGISRHIESFLGGKSRRRYRKTTQLRKKTKRTKRTTRKRR